MVDVTEQMANAVDPKAIIDTSMKSSKEDSLGPIIEGDLFSATVRYKNLHLTMENPTTSPLLITLKKNPINMEVGGYYGNMSDVFFDIESKTMLDLAAQAEKFKLLPEEQRPRAILELLRRNVQYSYDDTVDALSVNDPELAQWVKENVGIKSRKSRIPLSEIFDKGYGICGHLSCAYLYLLQKAGLKGTIMLSEPSKIRNILRTDTNKPLFKSFPVGGNVDSHYWVEVQMSNGTWIPVDPSTQIVGDTEQGMQMFREADYTGTPEGRVINFDQPDIGFDILEAGFKPGNATAQEMVTFFLRSSRDKQVIQGFKTIVTPPTNIPFSGDMTFHISTKNNRSSVMNLSLQDIQSSVN